MNLFSTGTPERLVPEQIKDRYIIYRCI